MKRNWLLVLLTVVFMIEILVFAPEEINQNRPKGESDNVASTNPEQTLEGVQSVETKDGHKEWELWSERALGFREKGNWTLEKVRVQVFSEKGFSYVITGDRGVVSEQRDLQIEGNVITKSSNGYTFTANSVKYLSKDRTLNSPGPIVMHGSEKKSHEGYMELKGVDMRANLNDEHIFIDHDVSAVKQISPTQDITIQSQRASFSSKDSSASFFDDVIVETDGSRITGPKAVFDFDETDHTVRSLLMDGGVRLTDTDRWATGQKIKMLFKEDRFILSGAPRVIQNSDELTGDEIIYSHGGSEIQVKGVSARFEDAQQPGPSPSGKKKNPTGSTATGVSGTDSSKDVK